MATPSSRSDTEQMQLDYSKLPHRFMESSDKPTAKKPSRCPGCRKRFKNKLQSRNCGLCGAVLCQQCTIYRRRICSVSRTPYDLGVLTNVCEKCFKSKVDFGCHKDHLSEFKKYRREKLEANEGKPACSRTYTGTKLIHEELDRLLEGFAAAASGQIQIPERQKSANWVEPGSANKCYQCKRKFRIFRSKHNCRIGGQVCCAKCTKKEGLIIYQDAREEEPKWGINGRKNGPKTKYRLEIYTICSSCSDHLEAMLVKHADMSRQKRVFMDSVHEGQKRISRMQANVDKWLPEYQQEVEAVNLGMRSIQSTEGKLARLHLNLSNTLPAIESDGRRLLELHQRRQSPVNDQPQKLLTRVLTGTEMTYKKHAKEFRWTNTQLPNQLSRENLCQVQEKRGQGGVLYVRANIRRLIADLQEYTEYLDGTFLEDVEKIELAITEELKPWPKRMSCNWDEHLREESTSRIDVAQMVKTSANRDHVKIVITSQSSTILQQCSSKLKDETLDLEFQETKQSLKQALDGLEMALIKLNRNACIAFE